MLSYSKQIGGEATQSRTSAVALLKVITQYSKLGLPQDQAEVNGRLPSLQRIRGFIDRGEKIQLVLPAFPAKSPNPEKTCGSLPDLGEVLGLQRLERMCAQIESAYSPGAEVVVCSDGRVFSDLVRVTDADVSQYREGIKEIIATHKFTRMHSHIR